MAGKAAARFVRALSEKRAIYPAGSSRQVLIL